MLGRDLPSSLDSAGGSGSRYARDERSERNVACPGDEIAERLAWLLRLRWLVLPVFIAVDLANDLLSQRRAPWTAVAVGGALIAANAVYAVLLRRPHELRNLLRWARIEAALVVALPVALVLLRGDPSNPLRVALLVGIVGAAAIPGAVDVAMIAAWGFASLVVADVIALDFDPARIGGAIVARWTVEAGVVLVVATIAGFLQKAAIRGPRSVGDAPRDASGAASGGAPEGGGRTRPQWDPALELVHELVVVTDRADRILRANSTFASVVGCRRPELAGRALSDVLAGHPEAWWAAAGEGAHEVEDPIFDTVFELRTTVAGDEVVRVARDVGEGRRLEARLVQTDKLASVGVLASSAAHEIGSPITFVSANLTELRRYLAAYEATLAELAEAAVAAGLADRVRARLAAGDIAIARREASAAIEESLHGMERINRIASDVRSLARRDPAGEPAAPVDLAEVVQAVCRTAGADLRSGESRVEVPAAAWVNGHRGELADVVLNLVVNAIQSRDEARPNQIVVSLRRENGHVVLRVADTGKGIQPAHMKRLFEPFFTTKPPGEGTGLGLSLTRRLIVQHGGSVDVASAPGIGSTFTVRLPALEDAPAQDLRPRLAASG
jgi:signal transduction histidine kinase